MDKQDSASTPVADAGYTQQEGKGDNAPAPQNKKKRLKNGRFKDRFIALIGLVALGALLYWNPAPLEILRTKTFDIYQRIKPREFPENRPVRIVDIDEESLAAVGQWPWPRTLVADLVNRLGEYGAVVIAFDMVFSEPDRMSPHNIAETIPNMSSNLKDGLKSLPSNDQILAEAVAKYRVVLGQAGRWVQDEGLRVAPHAERTAFATKGENPVRFLERF